MGESEDFEEFEATPEDLEEIINWAVRAAAVAHIIACTSDPENIEQLAEQFNTAREAMAALDDTIPESIDNMAIEIAHESIDLGYMIEEEVAQFRKEIEEFGGELDE